MKVIFFFLCLGWAIAGATPADSTRTPAGLVVGTWAMTGHSWGLQAGWERSRAQSGKWAVVTSTTLTYQRWPDRFSAYQVLAGAGVRREIGAGLYLEHLLRGGYQGRVNALDAYGLNADGAVVNLGRKWYTVFMGGASLGLGMSLNQLTDKDIRVFLRGNAFWSFPNYDHLYYFPGKSLEAGVVWGLGK